MITVPPVGIDPPGSGSCLRSPQSNRQQPAHQNSPAARAQTPQSRDQCPQTSSAAVNFLTRTFHNVLYVRVGKLIVCLWCSHSRMVICGGSQWNESWKTPATTATGAGATPTAATGDGTADTPHRYANRIQTWTSDLRRHLTHSLVAIC